MNNIDVFTSIDVHSGSSEDAKRASASGQGSTPADVGDFPNRLLQAVTSTSDLKSALVSVAQLTADQCSAAYVAYLHNSSTADHGASKPDQLFPAEHFALDPHASQTIQAIADRVMLEGSPKWASLRQGLSTVVVPVQRKGEPAEAIAAIVPANANKAACTALQFASSNITLWHVARMSLQAESDASSFAAIMDLVARMETCLTLDAAAVTLVNDLHDLLKCRVAALGLVQRRGCRLAAISGVRDVQAQSELAVDLNSALDEVLHQGELVCWPPDDANQMPSLVLRQLCQRAGAERVLAIPLQRDEHDSTAVLALLDPLPYCQGQKTEHFLLTSQSQLAACLELIKTANTGTFGRLRQSAESLVHNSRAYACLAAVALIAALLFFVMMPYRIGCQCEVQPVLRRFVVAPYDGRLHQTLVEPGDLVSVGQSLARMDSRELDWELQRRRAERTVAQKRHDSSLALGEFREAQQAELEMKNVDIQIQLLQHRQEQLIVKSPLQGIVVAGDLKDAEGAPVSIGQSLFEIAPLNEMLLEIAIPEQEIAHIQVGMPVQIWLDAYRTQSWKGRIEQLAPRPEIRDDQSVFIAEIQVDNAAGLLRPGMKGRAKVVADRHSLGWLLFHKPAETILMWLGW